MDRELTAAILQQVADYPKKVRRARAHVTESPALPAYEELMEAIPLLIIGMATRGSS